jgi:DNA replication protein DnaC
MSATDDLIPLLKKLRLSGVLQSLQLRTRQAVEDNLSHPEFLYRLLSDEVERREAKQLDLRIRRAAFEQPCTLEDFDFHFNPEIPKARVIDLGTCIFVERHENVLLVGKTGVGKSHLAQALGVRACRLGYDVLFESAQDLFRQLRAGRGDGTYDRKLARLAGVDLLVIDDLGLRVLSGDEPGDLYEVIRLRHGHHATILTSNRDEEELAALFGDPLLASAAMDRLLQHAQVLTLKGDSYRNPPPGKRARGSSQPSTPEGAR